MQCDFPSMVLGNSWNPPHIQPQSWPLFRKSLRNWTFTGDSSVNYAPLLIYGVISQKVRHGVMLLIIWPNPYGRGRWVPEGWGNFSNMHDAEADLDSLLCGPEFFALSPIGASTPEDRAQQHMCIWVHLLCTQSYPNGLLIDFYRNSSFHLCILRA